MRRVCPATLLLLSAVCFAATATPPKPGYVVHFDFLSNVHEARALVGIASRGGAKVINIVPPAHIWENRLALTMLDAILDEINRRRLSFVLTRIDASFPPDRNGARHNYLYGRILTEPGKMPNGRSTKEYFLTTVGRDGYAEWMEEETHYYARHLGKHSSLLGINLGPFSEPFVSQRSGLLEYMDGTQRYEVTQYTLYAEKIWHRWLAAHFGGVDALNQEYGTEFGSMAMVPMPLSESDNRFGKPQLAYFDFVRSINDWFMNRYERCRRIWHEVSGRADVPLILQFSCGAAEKFYMGRPSYAAFDLPAWVAAADALGLSLYTNSGFPDMGHASTEATVNLVAIACDLGKDVFVLEGGHEAPNVSIDPGELKFFGSVARKLNPRTYIYEFLKDKFLEENRSNPGKLVTADGRIRRPAFNALRKLFSEIGSSTSVPEKPALYVLSKPLTCRGNSLAGDINAAMYDLASSIPIRWIAPGTESAMRPGIPVLQLDGSVFPANEKLSHLLKNVPAIDTTDRSAWRGAVLAALSR